MRLFSWSGRIRGENGAAGCCLAGALIVFLVLGGATDTARANSLQQLLEQVGTEYAEAYASPLINGLGPNQNANLFSTASIPYSGLTFGIGIKVMGTYLNEADQTFQKVFQVDDLSEYFPDLSGSGTVVMSGPTVFGDTETSGQIVVYQGGLSTSYEGIPGFWDTRWVPLATPEANIGGIAGLKFTLRYFPSYDLGDLGKTTYLGYGLQWCANGVLKDLPIDIMAGFFLTSLDIENTQGLGEDKLVDTDANSYFVVVSKSWPAMTVYGGFSIEDSSMKVSYYHENEINPSRSGDINFDVDGIQGSRFTIGMTLDILLDLNLEAGFGEMTTYSAGLMFGF